MRIYLAGPYKAPTPEGVDHHIDVAREVAIALWEQGHGVFCPHLNTAHFELLAPGVPDHRYLDFYLSQVRHYAAVVMLPGWHESAGAQRERQEARAWGLVVYDYLEDVPDA